MSAGEVLSAVAAAGRFMAARRERVPLESNAEIRAGSIGGAYAVQVAHRNELLRETGDVVVGYKVGATSDDAQRHFGLDGPFFAPLLSSQVSRSPARLGGERFNHRIVEVELAFRIGQDIKADHQSPDDARPGIVEAIAAVMPSIEIADSRFAAWQTATGRDAIADLGFAGHWVYGAERTDWRGLDLLDISAALLADGTEIRRGLGRAVLGDPIRSVTLLARHLASHGAMLRAGDLVTTGSITAVYLATPSDRLVARFDGLATVEVTFI